MVRIGNSPEDTAHLNAFNAGFTLPDRVNSTRIEDAYGVIAGRVGFASDRALFYAKGGVAFVGNSYSFSGSLLETSPFPTSRKLPCPSAV